MISEYEILFGRDKIAISEFTYFMNTSELCIMVYMSVVWSLLILHFYAVISRLRLVLGGMFLLFYILNYKLYIHREMVRSNRLLQHISYVHKRWAWPPVYAHKKCLSYRKFSVI